MRLTFSRMLDDFVPISSMLDQSPSAVVRLGERRSFWVLQDHSGKELDVESSRGSVAHVTLKNLTNLQARVDVEGRRPGRTFLRFFEKGNIKNGSINQLDIRVYDYRSFDVNIWLVTDGRGIAPTTKLATVLSELAEGNKYLLSQANVEFKVHHTGSFTVSADLSRRGLTEPEERAVWQELWDKARKVISSKAILNLFIVKDWGARDRLSDDGTQWMNVVGFGLHNYRLCILEDHDSPAKHRSVMIHEMLHNLGASHDDDHVEALMNSATNPWTNIYPDTVDEIHRAP